MSDTGRPGRYQRNASGLVGAMVVVVVIVVVVVASRALISRPSETTAAPLDYRGTVRDLQGSGFDPVYPGSLPAGWTAFNVDYTPGVPPAWGLDLHTPDQHYVGLEESSADVETVLERYVDPNPQRGTPLSTPGGLAPRWDGWSDRGGDHAYTATVRGRTVIVFGPAAVADLQTVVRSLTTAKLTTSGLPTATAAPR